MLICCQRKHGFCSDDGYHDHFYPFDDTDDGPFVEMKDGRSGQWKDYCYQSNHRGWCNYSIEIWPNSDSGWGEIYLCKHQNHAIKVYKDICEKKDYDWALKYLTDLANNADLKHFKKHGYSQDQINNYKERHGISELNNN